MNTPVKICGVTRVQDALAAARLGAHAIGLVFYEASPRNVDLDQAAAIARALPPFITVVGLFVNPTAQAVTQVLDRVPLGLLQFHGDEPAEFCSAFAIPYLKAVRVRPEIDLIEYATTYADARGVLLDAYREGIQGGTGVSFDWTLIPRRLTLPVVLSGGLTAANVGEAVRYARPAALDVSSGVESMPGIKDEQKMNAFIESVRNANV